MKILHFFKIYLPDSVGGIQQVINMIAKETAHLGITSEVLCLSAASSNSPLTVDNHLVHQCPITIDLASTPLSLAAFSRFRQLAATADLIHYHLPYPFADLLHFYSRTKKPTLVTYHSDIVKQKRLLQLYKPLQHRFLTSVDHIVATSPNYLASSKVLNKYRHKTSVIPLTSERSVKQAIGKTTLNKWTDKIGNKFFLFLGVLRYYKGLSFLLDAAQTAPFPIVIAGSGPEESALKQQAERLGLTNIHFVGFVSEEDKSALLELCYCFVFPSHLRSEAFGVSLLEAAMYGKPLISCEIGTGTTFINIHKQTGIAVKPADPQELSYAMNYLWNNPLEAAEMGERSKTRYLDVFTKDKMAESYTQLYKRLINGD